MQGTRRPPRLFVFVHFVAAAGILLGALAARSLLEPTSARQVTALAGLLCAFVVGLGIGEWRGLRYAKALERRRADSPA